MVHLRAVTCLEEPTWNLPLVLTSQLPSTLKRVRVHNPRLKPDICPYSPATPTWDPSKMLFFMPLGPTLHPLSSAPAPALHSVLQAGPTLHAPGTVLLLRAPPSLKPCQGNQLGGIPLRSEDDLRHPCHLLTLRIWCAVTLPIHMQA